MSYLNIAAYKFVQIGNPAGIATAFREQCEALDLKGTILLAEEGVNLFLAGEALNVHVFMDYLQSEQFGDLFTDLDIKASYSDEKPFKRMKVRLAKEIITMKHPTINPSGERAPVVTPVELKKWLDRGTDDQGREVVLLDTRNQFEVDYGTFAKATTMPIEKFSEFPQQAEEMLAAALDQDKTIVSFCTGGIRCEKAALYMQELGLKHVFQLDGGILRYFEDVGGDHYDGSCFVFDERIALTPDLRQEPGAVRKELPGALSCRTKL